MELTPRPPNERDPSRRTRETERTEARFRSMSFEELRAFCTEYEPTTTVGIFVLAERRYPYDANPEAKYLMLTDMLVTLGMLHMANIDEEIMSLMQ